MIYNAFCRLDCVRWKNTQTKLATPLRPQSWLYLKISVRVGADLTRTHYLRIDSTIVPEHDQEKRENLGTPGGFATWIRLGTVWFQIDVLLIRVFSSFFAHFCHESCVTHRYCERHLFLHSGVEKTFPNYKTVEELFDCLLHSLLVNDTSSLSSFLIEKVSFTATSPYGLEDLDGLIT